MNLLRTNLFPVFFIIILSSAILYVCGLDGVVPFLMSLIIYGIIFYILHLIWSTLRGKDIFSMQEFFLLFLKKISIGISIILVLFAGFGYYQNDLRPAQMPLYTLSNESKQVKFQTMSHIGSKSFYEGVKKEIEKSKQQGFVLFYEGVQPGSQKNIDDFNQAIGIDFNPDLYKNFSKLYGVDHQKNPEFLGISNNKDYNIDLDIDTIMSIYNKKTGNKNKMPKDAIKRKETQIADVGSDIIDSLSGLNEKELSVMRYMNKSILNFIIKNGSFRDAVVARLGNQDLFSVILDDRNIHLVENIISSKENNIFIIYGLMHYDGVIELLQEKDPKWKIQSVEYKKLID